MFFILKLVLIILLNKTYAYITQNIEVILLPAWNPTGAKEIPLTLKVFGKLIQLNLRKNQTISPAFAVWKYNAKDIIEKLSNLRASDTCLYYHEDHVSSAILNFCQEQGLKGLIIVENDILEIRPLQNVFAPLSFIDDFCVREQINQSFGKLYLIKRLFQYYDDSNSYFLDNVKRKPRHVQNTQNKFFIKLAVFVDAKAYDKWTQYFYYSNTTQEIRYLSFACVNQIQDFFDHPSLGVLIDISLVNLTIITKLPFEIKETFLLNSFCKYAHSINPPDESGHWDIALYITTMNISDFMEPVSDCNITEESYISDHFAISYFNSTCKSNQSCSVVEFAPDIVAFNTSIYMSYIGYFILRIKQTALYAAHAIGHVLGLQDDTKKENNTHTYVMSPEPWAYLRNITWSRNSHDVLKEQLKKISCLRDHTKLIKFDDNIDDINNDDINNDDNNWSKYVFINSIAFYNKHGLSGRKWTAKAQCELFLRDIDANVVTLLDICKHLECETPHKNNSYITGPALNETYCAFKKECHSGECVPIIEPPYNFRFCEKDNWSDWKVESCKSSCLEKSRGVLVKRRFCRHRTRRTANCVRPYYDVVLCNDSLLCHNRISVNDFTTKKCIIFAQWAKSIRLTGDIVPGQQVPHVAKKPWIACTIHCRKQASSDYYAPRLELLNVGINPYFPDGTWCHNEDGQDYYCRKHYCLPENYSFEESQEELLLRHYQNVSTNIQKKDN